MQRIVLSRIGVGEVLAVPIEESAGAADFLAGQLALALDRRYSAELQVSADGYLWTILRSVDGQGGEGGGARPTD